MAREKRRPNVPNTGSEEIPPGATTAAADRPLERGRGGPGSGAGERHAASDAGSADEEYGGVDSNQPIADPTLADEEVPPASGGPPYAGTAGGAVGGTPAEERSRGGRTGAGLRPGVNRRGESTVGADPSEPTE